MHTPMEAASHVSCWHPPYGFPSTTEIARPDRRIDRGTNLKSGDLYFINEVYVLDRVLAGAEMTSDRLIQTQEK